MKELLYGLILSIHPQHALEILNGNKTLELRKSVPKDFVGWVYGYVTKGKPYLIKRRYRNTTQGWFKVLEKIERRFENILNGTIPFRFWFDECETLKESKKDIGKYGYVVKGAEGFIARPLPSGLCLTDDEILNYGKGKDLYAWHIKQLEIFDKPMQLSEFYSKNPEPYTIRSGHKVGYVIPMKESLTVKRPPQSWQYAWIKEELKK